MKNVQTNAVKNNNSLILSSPFSILKGVGSSFVKIFSKLTNSNRIIFLLLHKPIRSEKISIYPKIFEISSGQIVAIKAKIDSHIKPVKSGQPYKILCYTPSGFFYLVFFKIFPSQIAKIKVKEELLIVGRFQRNIGENQIIHPQEILPVNQEFRIPKFDVEYPLVAGMNQKFLRYKIREIISKLVLEEEWIDKNLMKNNLWPNFVEALKNIHYFNIISQEIWNVARRRIAYDELLSWQIALNLSKRKKIDNKKFLPISPEIIKDFFSSLPFEPTSDQTKAIDQIAIDISSKKRMLRMLQGDVGSGKTLVALASSLIVILSQKKQVCLIAPTTTLAKQHFKYFKKFLEKFNLNIEILISSTTKKNRQNILEKLYDGKIDILIGTHAIIESEVTFKNLGLAIIDEQHRFGVMQRIKLVEKGNDVDVLLMSATPIPRSLMMVISGDIDISVIKEKPKNRQKILTSILSAKKIEELFSSIKNAINRDEKVYWICPAIEENEEVSLISVTKKFVEISAKFGEKNVGLLHGKMKEKDKEKVMNDFAFGSLKILVATTVVEVGVDVPDATIIVIENAENFGLSQLHQLRGRVGRSDKKSFCILLYGDRYTLNAQKRLKILKSSDDGFFIAEEDLKIRGSGDLLGIKQSGFPEFRIADLNLDNDLLLIANKQAKLILDSSFLEDNNLKIEMKNDHNQEFSIDRLEDKYQNLLKIFGYEDALKIVSSG